MPYSALFSFLKKKTFGFIVVIILGLFFITPPSTHAQSVSSQSDLAPGVEQNQHTRAQTVLYDVLSAISCVTTGIDPLNNKGCLGFDPNTKQYSYSTDKNTQVGGAIGFAANSISGLYNIPVSGISYISYVADNFGVAEKAHADSGFDQLRGVLPVWVIFRNLAYLLFVLLFAFIGLGVMLRIKIDPRTVMSIQNQIPKVIVGLILITFSYAITGFMIDLMWVSTYTVIRITGNVTYDNGKPVFMTKDTTNDLLSSPIGFFNDLLVDVTMGTKSCSYIQYGDHNPWIDGCPNGIIGLAGSVGGTVGGIVGEMFAPFKGSATKSGCLGWTGPNIESCAHEAVYGIFKFITGIIAFFIVAFALMIALFKTWWSLLKSFAYIVIYTTLAPMYIVAGLFPGSQTNFTSWFRGLIANLAVYPATVGFFLAAKIFLRTFSSTSFAPPITGNPSAVGGFGYICAFAIIMVIPELINMLRDALKAPPNKYIAPSITRGVQSGAAPVTGALNVGWNRLWRPYDPISGHEPGLVRRALVGTGTRPGRFHTFMRAIIGGGQLRP